MSQLAGLTDALVERMDVPGPRYTSYPTVPEWQSDYGNEEFWGSVDRASRSKDPLGLYVHVPFCAERCSFCGCNVVVTRSSAKADRYLDYLAREIELVAPPLAGARRLAQIHWGGGTPTFLSPTQIQRLFRLVTDHFEVQTNAEIALEIDPKVTTDEQIALLGELGFNRLSMGIQDFDPDVQEAIHRRQSFSSTRDAVHRARKAGFGGINFDLIYGLPRQTSASWDRTLDQVIELAPDRLAIYGFAYLPELRPHQKRLPVADLPEGPAKHRLFRQAYERLVEAGYRPIGMDHFARPNDELARAQAERRLGRNFQGYTVRSARDTVAFGLTAISDLAGHLAQRVPQMKRYEGALNLDRVPIQRGVARSQEDDERGRIIDDLMCNFWVDLGDRKMSFESEWAELDRFEDEGLLRRTNAEIEVTPLGRFFVRNIAMVFDGYLQANRRHYSRTV